MDRKAFSLSADKIEVVEQLHTLDRVQDAMRASFNWKPESHERVREAYYHGGVATSDSDFDAE